LKNIGIGLCCPLKWPNDGDKDAVFLVGLKNGKLYPISDLFNIFEISFPKGKPQANFDDAKNTSKKQRAKEPNESSLAPHPSQYPRKGWEVHSHWHTPEHNTSQIPFFQPLLGFH